MATVQLFNYCSTTFFRVVEHKFRVLYLYKYKYNSLIVNILYINKKVLKILININCSTVQLLLYRFKKVVLIILFLGGILNILKYDF